MLRFACFLHGLIFRRFKQSVVWETDVVRQVRLAKWLTRFARLSGCGHYVSKEVEEAFLAYARAIDVQLQEEFVPRSVLIVMTEAYALGGHTRVVERWVSLDCSRVYSLVLTGQAVADVPQSIRQAIEASGGSVVSALSKDPLVVAAELRKMSARFESVILFTHPNDPLPLIAYGTDDFTRPVGFFNHMDHAFWFGASIIDGLAEMRTWGQELSRARRGLADVPSTVVGIPGDCVSRGIVDRARVRKRLGLPSDLKIVITAGSAYKYRTLNGVDFSEIAAQLLETDSTVLVLCIGMDFSDFPQWRRLVDRYGDRFRLMGKIPHDEFGDFVVAADLFIGSVPVPGFTTVVDALVAKTPSLFLSTSAGLMDWMAGSIACCHSEAELVRKAHEILSDRHVANRYFDELANRLSEMSRSDAFLRQVNVFFERLLTAGCHSVRRICQPSRSHSKFDQLLLTIGRRDLAKDAETTLKEFLGQWSWPIALLRLTCHGKGDK